MVKKLALVAICFAYLAGTAMAQDAKTVIAGAKILAVLVSTIGLALSAGSIDSTPAAPVCTHRTLDARGRFAAVRLPSTTSASGRRWRNSAAVFTSVSSTFGAAVVILWISCGSKAVDVRMRIGSAE